MTQPNQPIPVRLDLTGLTDALADALPDGVTPAVLAVPVHPVREPVTIETTINGFTQKNVVHDSSQTVTQLDIHPDDHALKPLRMQVAHKYLKLEDWATYVAAYGDDGTRSWATPARDGIRVESVIDYPVPGDTSWVEHRATLALPFSDAWQAWTALATPVRTDKLADFLDEHRSDIITPAAQELWDLVATLGATSNMTVKTNRRLTGGGSFTFAEDTSISAELPPVIVVGIPVFALRPNVRVELRPKWTLNDGKLMIGLSVLDKQAVLDAAQQDVIDVCQADSGHPVGLGSYS